MKESANRLSPSLPSSLPLPLTPECLQHLLVALPAAQHDGALGHQSGSHTLGVLQHRQALLVGSPRVSNQPGGEFQTCEKER